MVRSCNPGSTERSFLDGKTIYVRKESEEREEYPINVGDQLMVEDGAEVTPGAQLTYGPLDPHQVLHTLGADAAQQYIIDEVQKVYRSQGVNTKRQAHRGYLPPDAAQGSGAVPRRHRPARRRHV